MLEIKNVWKTFNKGTVNEKQALCGVNLTLNDGDFCTVIGGNGAGILFFCARQKRLRQVPVPERCAAAALLFFLILQILSFSTEAESSQPPMRSENQKTAGRQ